MKFNEASFRPSFRKPLLFGFAALGSFSSLPLPFFPPLFIPHMTALRSPRHLREHRLRRIHRRAERIPPAPRYVILTLLRSW